MIIDELSVRESRDGTERSARVRWEDGEARLRLRAPSGFAAEESDASPYLAAGLPLAMRRSEDLEIDGTVSPGLLARADHIQGVYAAWNPWLHAVAVRAAGEQEVPPAAGAQAVACFYSRGVDSTYAAVAPRPGQPALTHLLFVDGLDLRHDATVRAEEVRRAGEGAQAVGLPLLLAATNLRELSEPLCDWEDMAGAGLAFVALSLAAGLRRAVIPSTDSAMGLQACGTSPILDPLFSTEALTVEHEAPWRTRVAKIAWLAEHRPETLRRLKVCFAENRPDNCGRCGKCMLTLAGLMAAGALELAEDFPDRVPDDVDDRPQSSAMWSIRHETAEGARVLARDGEQGRLRRVLLGQVARPGRWVDPTADPAWETSLRTHQGRAIVSLLRDGRPYPVIPGEPAPTPHPGWPGRPGLVRVLDPAAGRHVYGVGGIPPGRVVAELGVLCDRPPADGLPAWLDEAGRLVTATWSPDVPRRSALAAVRWALAPLSWRGLPGRAGVVAWRLRRLAAPSPPAPAAPAGEPAGWLHAEQAPDRVPLYAALHPVTGDQLLSASQWEASDMGYVETRLLGWLEPGTPLTGGVEADRPPLPWASRLGRTARV
jgi:hypothetical protein